MDSKLASTPLPEDPKKVNGFRINPRLVVSFVLFALGFASISYGNFLSSYPPNFFNIFTDSGTIIFYTIRVILPPFGLLLLIIASYLIVTIIVSNIRNSVSFQQEDLSALRARVDKEPGLVEPIWDLGRGNLQQYFNRNLRQISNIYWLSVVVMIVGFILIVVGILESYALGTKGNAVITPALIGALAGVITEFIGATFLFIYRSTVQQASNYMKTLERINSVGMATKILDTISNDSQELQDTTKAEIVKLLLSQSIEQKENTKS